VNPTIGGWNPPSSRPNPSFSAPGWSAQTGGQFNSNIPSSIPSSSTLIPMKSFITVNPPLSSSVSSGRCHFYSMGNPQHKVPSSRGNVYNPYHVTYMGMVSLQPFMNQFGGEYYPTRQGHGIYQNPGCSTIP